MSPEILYPHGGFLCDFGFVFFLPIQFTQCTSHDKQLISLLTKLILLFI